MVAGDLVNTASRIQSAAEPGTVLVGEITRRATEAAITYESAGEHALKGKTEPVPLHRALRVIAARGGAMRSAALEPPFVGRDRELRLVKELFHACGEEGKAQLVSRRRDRRHRQVETRLGVREVHRRAGRLLRVAPRPVPRLRRRRRVLGARRDGADARRHPRGRAARSRRSRSCRRRSRSTSPTRTSGAGSSRASRTCLASPSGLRRIAKTSSPRGGSSSSGSATSGR